MRILVTGGAGFIGAHLLEHLLKNTNYEIVTLDRLDTSGNPHRLIHLACPRLKFMYWDLKSPISSHAMLHTGVESICVLGSSLSKTRPSSVFHSTLFSTRFIAFSFGWWLSIKQYMGPSLFPLSSGPIALTVHPLSRDNKPMFPR